MSHLPHPARAARPQSRGEELANAASHGAGAVGLIVTAVCLLPGVTRAGGFALTGALLFLGTGLLLYLSSTLYHALPRNRAKRVFERIDHSAIYLFIAGTYTPFLLGALRGGWGWSLLGIIWVLAVLGAVFKSVFGIRWKKLSTWLYVAMGWLVVVAAGPLVQRLPAGGLAWLAAGGLAYTGGALFYLFDHRIRYAHFVWHLFVLAGTACHCVAVFRYA